MLSYLLYSVVPIAAISGSAFYAYKVHPDLLLRLFLRYQLYKLNFKINYVKTPERVFCYAQRKLVENSPRPTLLLLHGFSASKDMWLWMSKFLPQDLELIAVDLPGHGETETFDGDDLSIEGQADAVFKFVTALGLDKKPLHVCGASMGGAIAGTYAGKYKDSLTLVSLLCPAMKTPVPSQFQESIYAGDSIHDWLVPETPAQVQKMFSACSHEPKPSAPGILTAVARLRRPRNPFFLRLWAILRKLLDTQDEHMAKFSDISVPGQLIWGEKDNIIHPSGAGVIKQLRPDVNLVLVENAGHSLAMERPRKVAQLIVQFQDNCLDVEAKHDS